MVPLCNRAKKNLEYQNISLRTESNSLLWLNIQQDETEHKKDEADVADLD